MSLLEINLIAVLLIVVFSLSRIPFIPRSMGTGRAEIYTNTLLSLGATVILTFCGGAFIRYGGYTPSYIGDGRMVFAIPICFVLFTFILLMTATVLYLLLNHFTDRTRPFKQPNPTVLLVTNFVMFVVLLWLCLIGN